jgi:hypothetical protein
VVVRRSVSADVDRLVADLASADEPRREAAVARLSVIGERAVSRVLAIAASGDAPVASRAAALQVLESTGDSRGAAVALELTRSAEPALAAGAIAVLGRVARGIDRRATRALDRLSEIALSREAAVDARLAALAALDGLPARQIRPIYEALARDPASRVVARVTRHRAGVMAPLDDVLEAGLPNDPALVAAIIREDADDASMPVLRRTIEAVRLHEGRSRGAERGAWLSIRGQVHQALAARGSRIALYDLRETLESATAPLPVGFLAAAAAIGDTSCLEPVARLWTASDSGERWWREHLEDVFQAIVTRERVTRRHAALVRILGRFPAAGVLVAAAPKNRRHGRT